jgi:ADP-heptose:LPS heptosyltransferase
MEEQTSALDRLRVMRRPLIAVHPGGKTSSPPNSPWHEKHWVELIHRCRDVADFIQISKHDYDLRNLGIPSPRTTLRQMFAIIWACDGFIGFDSGPMHVASAFERPSVIIWDAERKLVAEESWQRGFSPAVTLRWGYPQNRNLMILGERNDELIVQMERWVRELCMRLT